MRTTPSASGRLGSRSSPTSSRRVHGRCRRGAAGCGWLPLAHQDAGSSPPPGSACSRAHRVLRPSSGCAGRRRESTRRYRQDRASQPVRKERSGVGHRGRPPHCRVAAGGTRNTTRANHRDSPREAERDKRLSRHREGDAASATFPEHGHRRASDSRELRPSGRARRTDVHREHRERRAEQAPRAPEKRSGSVTERSRSRTIQRAARSGRRARRSRGLRAAQGRRSDVPARVAKTAVAPAQQHEPRRRGTT